ncbi:hypothetical protein BC835DRAFT_1411979 [Cytidiella melzeri]|nr:hypothetical protein BC835DRAFT_1411979 [Cytidiella melzeri]
MSTASELKSSRYHSSIRRTCEYCQKEWDSKGYTRHVTACQKKAELAARFQQSKVEAEIQDGLRRHKKRVRAQLASGSVPHNEQPQMSYDPADVPLNSDAVNPLDHGDLSPFEAGESAAQLGHCDWPLNDPSQFPSSSVNGDVQSPSPNSQASAEVQVPLAETQHPLDSINTHRQPSIDMLPPPISPNDQPQHPSIDDIKVEYHAGAQRPTVVFAFEDFCEERLQPDPSVLNDKPWHPFNSREDFEFAELVHEARMSQDMINRLLKLMQKVNSGQSGLTFSTYADVRQAWEKASLFYPMFTKSTVSAEYKKVNYEFDLHHRSLWDWIVSQVQDPKLASSFHWDAQRQYKYDGTRWVRFYEQLWTGDMFWDVQSDILSTDTEGKPLGIILWADKTKLSTFGTQKGHPIVARIANLDEKVRNGIGVGGGRIVGLIPVIEDDAQEKSKKPYIDWKNAIYHDAFRVLLEQVAQHSRTGYRTTRNIPKGELSDLSSRHPERSEEHVQELVERKEGKGAKEDSLKLLGLRAVKNAFWPVLRTNIFKSLSFDRLHAYLLGLFLHLLRPLKTIIADLGRKAQTFVDQSLNAVPSWSGLTRFSSLTHLDFNDGSKWAALSKILIQCCFSIIPEHSSGFELLKAIRKYLECDMYVSFHVHTDDTLEDYDKTIQQFGQRLVTYREACGDNDDGKDWDSIIKVHTHLHATRDIRLKGTMINMDTKTSERLNAPLRKAYLMQTNFKNVEGQLAHLDDLSMVICDVRGAVDAWDEYMSSQEEVTAELKKDSPSQFGHVYLGARCPPTKISTLALDFVEDEAFHDFRKKIQRCIVDLNRRSAQSGGSLQDGLDTALRSRQAIKVHADDQIIEHRYIRVDYDFHGAPRHDTVIVNVGPDEMSAFCKLILPFTYKYEETVYALALDYAGYESSLVGSHKSYLCGLSDEVHSW